MRFAQPSYLYYAFLTGAAFVLFYLWAFKMRKAALKRFAQEGLLQELLSHLNHRARLLKAVCIIAGVVVSGLALARPQWGFRWEETRRKGLDILIALDSSKSMLAEDIKPSRLERAKLALRDLVKEVKGDRLGLVAFSGSAFLECPLTVDYGGFLLVLDSLDSDTIPRGGTDISSAIREALRSYAGGEKKYKVLVIISDGEDLEGDAVSLAEDAKKEGIVVYCIGVGTREGELIPVRRPDGSMAFLKDSAGNVVKTRLNEQVLEGIALNTGGSYVRATPLEFGLDVLYRQRISKMEKKEQEGKMAKRYFERFQIPLTIALLLLLLEPFISDRK